MEHLIEIFANKIIQTAILAWFIAQLIKVILTLLKENTLDFTRLFGSGGMPSSHAAFTVALATAVGFTSSFSSVDFALAAAFAIVVMYDATGVRRSAGEQAAILNKIVEKLGKEHISETGKKLKELLGHTPVQVFAGAILGLFVAIIRYI